MRRLIQPESDIDRNALGEAQRKTARELRGITHSDAKNDRSDAEKLARYARLDPELLHSVQDRDEQQPVELSAVRARDVLHSGQEFERISGDSLE